MTVNDMRTVVESAKTEIERLREVNMKMMEALEHAYAIFLQDETLGNSVDYNDVRGHLASVIQKARQ